MTVENPAHVEMSGVRKVQFNATEGSIIHSNELRDRAPRVAEYRTDLPNYIVFPFINKHERPEFDKEAQELTARLLLEAFPGIAPDYLIGIGNSGIPLAHAVSRELQANGARPQFVEVTNLEGLDEDKRPEGGFVFTAHSYSRQKEIQFHLPELLAGKTALVIDDVLAEGGISQDVLRQILSLGVDVKGFGVYFTKLWEGGVEKIVNEFGIPIVAAIAIAKKEGEKLIFVPDDETFVRYEKPDPSESRDSNAVRNGHLTEAYRMRGTNAPRYPTNDIQK